MATRKITELPVAASASSGDYVIAAVSGAARRVPMLVSDASLSMPGQAAEAKATGDRLNALDRATEDLNAVAEDLNDRMPTVDVTLSQSGQAAEAKATGDRLTALDRATEDLNAVAEDLNDRMLTADVTLSQSGQAAEAKATGDRLNALDRATEDLNAVAEDLNDRMPTVDVTLSQSGQAAEAKATGDKLSELEDTKARALQCKEEGNTVEAYPDAGSPLRPVTRIEPIQSGSGDPYPAGGGRNLLPYPYYTSSGNINGITYNTNSDGSITANGTPTDTSKYSIYYLFPGKYTESKSMFSLPAGDWVLCSEGAADNSKMYPVVNERISDSEYKTLASGTKKNQAPFTLNEAKTNLYMSLVCVPGYAPNNETVKIGIVKNGDSTAWQPYSNIRPISGRETVNLNHTDAHYAGWKDIIADINNGLGAAKYPVGTKFVTPHSVYGERLFEVVAHDYLKAVGDDGKHTMTIQQHDLLPTTQFDASEAFYYAEAELPAGTYNFTLATAYSSWAEGTYQFTLTQAVPAGGQLAISGYADAAMTALQVRAYTNQTTTTATESVAITAGSGGTNLGTFGEDLNHSHRVSYGSNNYKESAIRQFLNSSDAAGSVWTPQTKFDRPPSWLTSLAGYKNGLGQDFLAVVGKVALPCSANDTYEAPDSSIAKGTKYTLNDEFYLASSTEIFGSHDVDDGTVLFPFYEGAGNADRIKYRDGSAAPWWLRTPYSGHAHNVRRVNSDGTVGNHNARHSIGLAPACTIYDTGIVPNGAVRIIAKDEEFTVENKQTYTAQLGQTVYGGTVDWSKGVLTVDWASVEFDGETDNETWYYSTDTNRVYFRDASQKMPIGLISKPAVGFYLSDRYKPMEKYHSDEGHQFELGFVDEAIHGVAFWDSINGTGVNEWKSYLAAQYAAGTPVQIAYKLAEPVTVSLPPIRIEALDGANTVYTDSGPLSLTYNKSLEKAFEEAIARIAALEAAVLNNV